MCGRSLSQAFGVPVHSEVKKMANFFILDSTNRGVPPAVATALAKIGVRQENSVVAAGYKLLSDGQSEMGLHGTVGSSKPLRTAAPLYPKLFHAFADHDNPPPETAYISLVDPGRRHFFATAIQVSL